jgi:hypothetical protein
MESRRGRELSGVRGVEPRPHQAQTLNRIYRVHGDLVWQMDVVLFDEHQCLLHYASTVCQCQLDRLLAECLQIHDVPEQRMQAFGRSLR